MDDTRRQMLADLAHEIRTPVSVLEAYMEALEDGVQTLDEETFATLRDQTRRLARFSIDVTSLAAAERRATSIDARWTSPEEMITAALSAFGPRYGAKGVTLDSRIPADLPELWADPETARSGAGQPARQRATAYKHGRARQRHDLGQRRMNSSPPSPTPATA